MNAIHDPFAPLDPAEMATPAAAPSARKDSAWVPVLPAPVPLPKALRHWRHGAPALVWRYLDASGALLFAVARFNLKNPDGTPKLNAKGKPEKEVLPYTCGAKRWAWQGPPKPTPLYGLDQLAARPHAPVLVVEGEKTADAAARLFPTYVVVTWQGGAGNADEADWRPLAGRRVTIWPDKDAAGRKQRWRWRRRWRHAR